MPPESVLRVRGLHKSFTLHAIGGRVVRALRGVDLAVAAGEHVALAGPSGAGKSSLLKCVYRTYRPDRGELRYRDGAGADRELSTLPDREIATLRAGEIGYVSQFLRADPRRSALDAVARAARRRGREAAEAREAAGRVLAQLRVPESLWGTYPTLLSGGEKQRVNLAAALVHPPRLLLLDEPVASLDPANRDAVLDLVGDLAGRGVAVLSVFHDAGAIARLAQRVVALRAGRVVAEGSPAEVLDLAGVA